jgi:hypothetical protein
MGVAFKTEIAEMNVCKEGKHEIETGYCRPIYQRNYKVLIHFEKAIDAEIERNLRVNTIRPSKSPWCSIIVLIKRKDGLYECA